MHRLTVRFLAALLVLTPVVAPALAWAQLPPPPQVRGRTLSTVTDAGRQVFRLDARDGDGVAWWPDVAFATGTIELDMRGRNVPQASFVGVAFHAVDATTYEAVYFRPFNFRSDDPARRLHGVQYISQPTDTWPRLREQHPGVYEHEVVPPPDPDGWFHATIRVAADTVQVFVDNAKTPALVVHRLTDRAAGSVGIWVGNGSPGDFANVRVTPERRAAAAVAPAGGSLSGTYRGQLVAEGGGNAPEDGIIVIVDRGSAVEVMLGQDVDQMLPATNVRRHGDALTFELDAPGDPPNHLAFDVRVEGAALSGSLVQTRDGQTGRARVAFTKQ